MINPEGVRHQIHGNVIQSTSRVLKEKVTFSDIAVTSRDWGSYPLLTFPELPAIDVLMVPRPEDEPLGVGESTSVPSAAAIANAIFDATGVRFREPPFTPDRILKGLREAGFAEEAPRETPSLAIPATAPAKPRRRLGPLLAAAFGALGSLGVASLPIRGAIAPIARPGSRDLVRRDHRTRPGARRSRRAFIAIPRQAARSSRADAPSLRPSARSMRHKHHARRSDGYRDMVLPGLRAGDARGGRTRRAPSLSGVPLYVLHQDERGRPAGALCLFHGSAAGLGAEPSGGPSRPVWLSSAHGGVEHDVSSGEALPGEARSRRSMESRAYLVEALGHCSACHSPRNSLGAELKGADRLAGGEVDGWFAPPLNGSSPAPIAWTEQAYFDYLRSGFSAEHGAAGGPMAPVVAGLKPLPNSDIRAMARYLVSLAPAPPAADPGLKARLEQAAKTRASNPATFAGARIHDGACAVCHEPGQGLDMFGVKPSLALNSAIHAEKPDTVLRVILDGAHPERLGELGPCPPSAITSMTRRSLTSWPICAPASPRTSRPGADFGRPPPGCAQKP